MHNMRSSTHPGHNTLFIVSCLVLFLVPSFVTSGVSENDRENEITESKHSRRSEDETEDIGDTRTAQEFIEGREQDSKTESETNTKDEDSQTPMMNDAEDYSKQPESEEPQESPVPDSGIRQKDSNPESETDSKDEESQESVNDSEPEGQTQESPGSDSSPYETDSRDESETDSKDEDNQEPTTDEQDYSKSPEPEDETQESPGSDSGIHEKDSRDESETDSKDEDNQGPTNNAQDYSEQPESEDETQESPVPDLDIPEKESKPESETDKKDENRQTPIVNDVKSPVSDSGIHEKDSRDESEADSKDEDNQGPTNDAQDYSERPEPEDETQESPGSDSGIHEKDSGHESETSSEYEDNQEPMDDAPDYTENPESEDVTQTPSGFDSGSHGTDSKTESETGSTDEESQTPMNDKGDYSTNPVPEDEVQTSPDSASGIHENDSKPESETDSKDEDNQGTMADEEDSTHESPGSDSGIHRKDSRMETETDAIDQTQSENEYLEDREHGHQKQDVIRENFKSKEVFLSKENRDDQSKEQDNQERRNDSDDSSENPVAEDEMQDSPSSDSDMHDKSREMILNHIVLTSKTHLRKSASGEKFNETNPVHVFLKGKKHHRQNGIHEKINKTNPVHVFLKGKKHHRHHGLHEIVDKTNPVHVFLKNRKHEDQEHSQNDYGVNAHSSQENVQHQHDSHGSKDTYLVKEFLSARGRQEHVHKSHGFEGIKGYSGLDRGSHHLHKTHQGKHTDEHDRPKEMKSAESVLIPQESVKVADLLQISSEVKHLDTVVNRISRYVRRTLAKIQNNMHEMANMVSAVHPIAPSTMSHMINVTMTKTEKAVRKLCLEPIQKSLSIPPWSTWTSWGKCSLTCGNGGYKLRHRQCQSKSHHQCLGNNFDLCHCVLTPCAATWQLWSQWTPCSATCDNGHQMRTRMCLTSSERVHCNGTTSEIKYCFSHKCDNSVRQKSTLLDHLHFKSKSGNKIKFLMKFAMHGSSNSTDTSSGYAWSAWSGWTSCKECRRGHRERKRLCVNSLKEPLYDKTLCPGADVEFGPCVGLVCNRENAVYVSEGKSIKVKCGVPPDLIPDRIYWITPRNQRITHLSSSKRIHMSGSSLHVTAARYADQGVYRCVLLLKNNTLHIIQDTLVVDTCKTHHCQNGGICQTTQDPEFDGIMNYKCRCIGKYRGPFCEIGPLNTNKLIGAIIALIIALVVVLALALFLLRRSLSKTKFDSPKEYQWKKKGKSQIKKTTKSPKTSDKPIPAERHEDKGDISNTSIVSNDGSFVEISEHDYVDLDGLNDSQEEKNLRGGYESGNASGGYEGKFLKYPSPPHKHMSQNYQQKESEYMTMDTLPQNFIINQHKPAGFYDEESAFQDVCSGKVENIYENLPMGERREPIYTPTSKSEQEYIDTLKYKASLKQRRASVDKEVLAQEALDIVAENLTRQCLVAIENESQNSNKVVSTGLNTSQIGSDTPKLMKDKSCGKPVAMDTNIADISAVQTESPNRNVENVKSPQRKTKSIKQTKSPQRQETATLTKSPITGVSAGHQSVSHNKTASEASNPKRNRPVDKTGRGSTPESQGFKQQLVTQTDARSPHVSKDRRPVPKPGRASEDTARQFQIRPLVSPTHRQYAFPKTLTIKDAKQEAALQEHFDTSFVTQQVNPSTSTPKKDDKIARMNIIMPSDIMQAHGDESSLTFGRKTHSSELMVVTSSKVLGKKEEGPVNLGRGNISSNNRQTSASELSSESEVFSDSYYQSMSQVTEPTDGSRGTSFRSLDTSASLQTMPDLDNTVSFPKLTISYQEEGLGQGAGPATPAESELWYPGQNESLFQGEITEGSLYLSDCNYTQGTPESSELSESVCSSGQTSDVEGSLDCTES